MHYYNTNPNNNHTLETKVKQLEHDNQNLSNVIQDLNSCYLQKISLLENTITQTQMKYEELLEWKQNHINKSLFEVEKYEIEIKKMIEILDMAHHNFQTEKEHLLQQLKGQSQEMRRLKEENEGLQHFNAQTEGKIEDMVKFYNQEIQKLKFQVKEMREQSMISEDSMIQPLRDISHNINNENMQPNEKVEYFGMEETNLKKMVKGLISE